MDFGSLEELQRCVRQLPTVETTPHTLPEGILATIIFQSLQGLLYLHRERHSVHRDLKPANILLDSSGFVKLSDFGVSKKLGTGTFAHAGTQVGTLAYMSPERVNGERYEYASDVWSLGLISLELAIGDYPYPRAHNIFDQGKMIVDGPVPTERAEVQQRLVEAQRPAELLELTHACLCKEAPRRPDVATLSRCAFFVRHLGQPADLRSYLLALQQHKQALAQQSSAADAGGELAGRGAAGLGDAGGGAAIGPSAMEMAAAPPAHGGAGAMVAELPGAAHADTSSSFALTQLAEDDGMMMDAPPPL
jgi:serine/threonine protein kinase